jgi:hypothetical protein
MQTAFHTTTTVLPGHRIEVSNPSLKEGDQVQVVVIPTPPIPSARTGPSALEIIESLKGHRIFQTAEEVDRYLNEERDSWDR